MSKSIKNTAATAAANKSAASLVAANAQIAALATKYTAHVHGMVGKEQLRVALAVRDILAKEPEAVTKPLVSAFGRQRKHDIGAVLGATDETLASAGELFPKNRKPGLQQMARAIGLTLAGIKNDGAAKRYLSTGKKADFLEATGQKAEPAAPAPAAVADSADSEPAPRTIERDNPQASEVGNLKRLTDLLPALEKEMADYGPECKKAMAAFKKAAESLSKAAANG